MTDTEFAQHVRYVNSIRTQTPEDVAKWADDHDRDDFTAKERLSQYGR